ncbi:aldehyde dehydrogenase [Labrenzia sp. R4_1]|uniref:aldehyde dehydrogenase n=1 Tax=Labrenzia sp. R4_1 TaxID=2821106 RepID=UPI001AD9A2B0|nr:aldehyde dehydrogenase [Labrenzia sp. R4_1]MBO9425652.1 aldehyde dehydrogenase [Labrenzia sp. R4_1]
MQHYQLYIDGGRCEGSGGQILHTENPATGDPWASFACADTRDVNRAVAAARRALEDPAWCDLTQTQRGKLLFRLAELVEAHSEDLGRLETTDSGKLLAETLSQTKYVGDYYRYYAGLADKIEGAVLPIDKPDMHVFTKREPVGVVAAVVPWNAQMFLTATKLGPALAAGCTVVLKASEIAPIPMLEFASLIDQAGFPPGVVSVITGNAEDCAVPLTRHPDVDRIAFTGGPETARHVVRNSAENFAVTSLELGGKSPVLVFDDADLDGAANGLIAGNFGASGQSCVAGSRALVQRTVFESLVDKITEKAAHISVGDPLEAATHVGPLCTNVQIERIKVTLNKAIEQGAEIRLGGAPLERSGNYMAPTLVACPNPDIETLKVEMFGPVMSLLPFDTEDEAIALANDTPYGLASGIFTRDVARAHRVSSRLRAGICWINTYRAISPIAPFGGFNQSGYGREAGIEAVLDYTRTKTVWINTSGEPMANPFVMR